jgi:hypothetical protein
MAATAVSTVLSKFGELALEEGRLLVQVGDKMTLLRDRLEWLQAFIRDADRKRRTGTDGLSRVWLRQTRDVAFQAEDALDQFFHQVPCFHPIFCDNSFSRRKRNPGTEIMHTDKLKMDGNINTKLPTVYGADFAQSNSSNVVLKFLFQSFL